MDDLYTLEEAREYINNNVAHGVECPCCTQYVKIYKRPINKAIVYFLLSLYRLDPKATRYYHYSEIMDRRFGGGDYCILRHWGLIEACPLKLNKDKKSSGHWKITKRGISFIKGKIKLQKYVHVYKARVYGFSGDMVSVYDCWKQKFSIKNILESNEDWLRIASSMNSSKKKQGENLWH